MNMISEKLLVVGIVFLLSLNVLAQRNKKTNATPLTFPFTEKHWISKSDNVQFADYKSTKAVKSSNDDPFEIVLKDMDFSTGTIEFDVELKGRGFPGINFH